MVDAESMRVLQPALVQLGKRRYRNCNANVGCVWPTYHVLIAAVKSHGYQRSNGIL